MFWYACGHCFLMEPSLESWARKGKPANVRAGARARDVERPPETHARVFYTAELLGKLPALHGEIYREINVRGNQLDTPAKIEAFFTSKGVSKQDFQKAFSSFAVETKLSRAAGSQQALPHHEHADGRGQRPLRDGRRDGRLRNGVIRPRERSGGPRNSAS